jgi:hypothetical protein
MRALLSPIVSIIERAGSGSRCASVLTFTGTGDGWGARAALDRRVGRVQHDLDLADEGDGVVDRRLAAALRRHHVAAQSNEAVVDDALDPLPIEGSRPDLADDRLANIL